MPGVTRPVVRATPWLARPVVRAAPWGGCPQRLIAWGKLQPASVLVVVLQLVPLMGCDVAMRGRGGLVLR
jgi:hypothetical protein